MENKKSDDVKITKFISHENERYFNSTVFSDFTFISSDQKEFPVHRNIIAIRSDVLDKMLISQFSEMKQAVIEDVNGDTLKEMLRFIYTGKVENLENVAFQLLYAAWKYNLPELKSICDDYFIGKISTESVCELFLEAVIYSEENLMKKCIEFIKM